MLFIIAVYRHTISIVIVYRFIIDYQLAKNTSKIFPLKIKKNSINFSDALVASLIFQQKKFNEIYLPPEGESSSSSFLSLVV